jgi:serine/threonine protein kinase
LIDFGIAGNTNVKAEDTSISGSLHYMPPEVLSSTNTAPDPATDIWAMGVILFVLVFGCLPFQGSVLAIG